MPATKSFRSGTCASTLFAANRSAAGLRRPFVCQLCAEILDARRDADFSGGLGHIGSRLDPQATDTSLDEILEQIAVVAGQLDDKSSSGPSRTDQSFARIPPGMAEPGIRIGRKIHVVAREDFAAADVFLDLHQAAILAEQCPQGIERLHLEQLVAGQEILAQRRHSQVHDQMQSALPQKRQPSRQGWPSWHRSAFTVSNTAVLITKPFQFTAVATVYIRDTVRLFNPARATNPNRADNRRSSFPCNGCRYWEHRDERPSRPCARSEIDAQARAARRVWHRGMHLRRREDNQSIRLSHESQLWIQLRFVPKLRTGAEYLCQCDSPLARRPFSIPILIVELVRRISQSAYPNTGDGIPSHSRIRTDKSAATSSTGTSAANTRCHDAA